jgi:hypothetical protein
MANGRKNGGGFADPSDRGTTDALMSVDLTTLGFVRLPVCGPELAFKAWDWGVDNPTPNYPCDAPRGRNSCDESSFEDQTSAVSPKVEDWLQIIRNIGGDPGIYFGWIAAHRPTTTEMSALSETEGGAVPDCKPRSPWQSSLCPGC